MLEELINSEKKTPVDQRLEDAKVRLIPGSSVIYFLTLLDFTRNRRPRSVVRTLVEGIPHPAPGCQRCHAAKRRASYRQRDALGPLHSTRQGDCGPGIRR